MVDKPIISPSNVIQSNKIYCDHDDGVEAIAFYRETQPSEEYFAVCQEHYFIVNYPPGKYQIYQMEEISKEEYLTGMLLTS